MSNKVISSPPGANKADVLEASHEQRPGSLPIHGASMVAAAQVLSLDVFDTVLTRACGSPKSLYLWLGRRLSTRGLISCTPETFARVRARAEQVVWDRAGGMDSYVELADFYAEVLRRLHMETARASAFAELELQLEVELLRGVPDAIALVRDTQSLGKRVVFATDTYFSGNFVECQLRRHGAWTERSLCLASTDEKACKASGKLFDRLLEIQGIDQQSLIHAGDNPHSDMKMSKSRGIRNFWLPDARLNRYEQLLCESRWETGGLTSALAGASRLARLQTPAATPREKALRDVAAGVASPILIGYVLWVLHRARDLGLKKLYFCARDGQVLVDIAQVLIKRLQWQLDVTYLYVSRQSINLAGTFATKDEDLAWVFRHISNLTPRQFLKRFDISWEEVSTQFEGTGLQAERSPITTDQARVLKQLVSSGKVRELVLCRAAARRELVMKYLAQEDMLDGTVCGIVDFGGIGSQMRALYLLLSESGYPPPHLFFIGLDSPDRQYNELITLPESPAWREKAEFYLYDHRLGLGVKRPRGFGTCVQIFCAADHSTVKGYDERNGRIAPVISDYSDPTMVQWGLPLVRETLRAVVKNLVVDPSLVDLRGDLRGAACDVIKSFWSNPTPDEVHAWGAFPMEGAEADGNKAKAVAWRYTWFSAIRGLFNKSFPNLGWQHWYEGSLRISSPTLRFMLRLAEKCYRAADVSSSRWGRLLARWIEIGLGRRKKRPR